MTAKPDMRTREGRRVVAAGAASLLLFVLPAPLLLRAVIALFGGNIVMLGLCSGLFLLAAFGAALVRRGLLHQARFETRRVVRAARLPWKLLGAAVLGAATGLSAILLAGHGIAAAAAFGAGALAGTLLLYGLDPVGSKGVDAEAGVEIDEVTDALDAARARIARIEMAAKAIGNREYRARLGAIVEWGRKILAAIEENPRGLRRARKFLNVYLEGADRVTAKYAATHTRTDTGALEDNFRALLDEMETTFREQHAKLMEQDVVDLDVQIAVLKTRLKREGVT